MITLDRDLLNRARRLPRFVERYDSNDEPMSPPEDEDGFVFVGAGSERTVWLGPDGYVYKCQNWEDDFSNVEEWRASLRLRNYNDLPLWLYIPETVYDQETGIAVAEYIQGKSPWTCYYDTCDCPGKVCRWNRATLAFEYCGSTDGHAGNCVIVEGYSPDDFVVAIIDFTR